MELPPEVQEAVARYLQGLNKPTPMSNSDRIDMVVPPSNNKASSYLASPVAEYIQQQDAYAHSAGIKDAPAMRGDGIQVSSSFAMPSASPQQLPFSQPTTTEYLNNQIENGNPVMYPPNYIY